MVIYGCMKMKFESSVNCILFLMFTSVLVLIAFSTCNCCSQPNGIRNGDSQEAQVKDSITDDTIK